MRVIASFPLKIECICYIWFCNWSYFAGKCCNCCWYEQILRFRSEFFLNVLFSGRQFRLSFSDLFYNDLRSQYPNHRNKGNLIGLAMKMVFRQHATDWFSTSFQNQRSFKSSEYNLIPALVIISGQNFEQFEHCKNKTTGKHRYIAWKLKSCNVKHIPLWECRTKEFKVPLEFNQIVWKKRKFFLQPNDNNECFQHFHFGD